MKKKSLLLCLGITVGVSGLCTGTAVAEDAYYDEGYYEDSYYDDGYYDDGYYDDTYYEDTYYDDGSYSQEEYYDEGSGTGEESSESQRETDAQGFPKQTPRTDISRGNAQRETPDENGKVHSYLTGQLTDASLALLRPMAVMINNVSAALPQAGLSNAGVIYECPVEGEITRLLAIFEDYNLEKIGPVRSCRDYFIDFALEFDALYTHYGQAVYAFDLLNSDMVNNISGLEYQEGAGKIDGYAGEDIFYRTSDRPAPHNAYTSYEGLQKAIEKKEYSTELDDDYTGHFSFADDGETISYTDGTATYIQPSLYTNKPYFEYDEATGLYKRFQFDGAHIDELTGEQLTFTNVIIQYCDCEPYDANDYLNIDTVTGNEAIIFTNGTYQKATWKKDSDWAPAKYYDADGNEIRINQGKTWVSVVKTKDKEDTMYK